MMHGSKQHEGGAPHGLPSWTECELFCIEEYAGAGGAPCGWRGRIQNAPRDAQMKFRCPRCGRATLLRIPFSGSDEPRA